jgi:hypothetical protein
MDSVQSYMPRDSLNSGRGSSAAGGPPSLEMPRSSSEQRRPRSLGVRCTGRPSGASDASGGTDPATGRAGSGSARSARSSFALEGGALGLGLEAASAASLTQLPQLPQHIMAQGSLFLQALPEPLRPYYRQLAVLPAGSPVPLVMLQRLWCLPSYGEAEHIAQALAAAGEPPALGPGLQRAALERACSLQSGAGHGRRCGRAPACAAAAPRGATGDASGPSQAPGRAPRPSCRPAGVLRIAELDDLAVWCLAAPEHVHFLALVQQEALPVGVPRRALGCALSRRPLPPRGP